MMDMKKHVTVAGALRIGMGVLGLLIAAFVFIAIVGGGLISGDRDAIAITSVVGTVISGFFGLISLPNIIAGWGLIRFKPWARILTLILAALDLVNVPVGTLLGIYTIWVILQDETEKLFAGNGPGA
jgi:hypothetical protein